LVFDVIGKEKIALKFMKINFSWVFVDISITKMDVLKSFIFSTPRQVDPVGMWRFWFIF